MTKRKRRKTLSTLPLVAPQTIAAGSFTARYIELHALLRRMPEDEELRRRVNSNCRVLMLSRGIASHRDLGKRIGVEKSTISMFFSRLKGRQTVPLLVRIAAVLGIAEPLDLLTLNLVQNGVRALNTESVPLA